MMMLRSLALTLTLAVSLGAQIPLGVTSVPDAPLPADSYEPVTTAEPTQDAAQRAAIINMLNNARELSNLRSQPYDIKTTFTSTNSAGFNGSWQLEDASPFRNAYRWTVQGPGYAAINLFLNRTLYSNQPTLEIPLRLAQVRAAMFFAYAMPGPRASVRTANVDYNGQSLLCGLIAFNTSGKPVSGPRNWNEAEYCASTKTGALVTYSLTPGSHVIYDYSQGLTFHSKFVYNKIVIVEAGQPVVETHTVSVTDPSNEEPANYKADGMNVIGVGSILSMPWRYRMFLPSPQSGETTAQFVVVHGIASIAGKLSELQVLSSSNPSLNQNAIDFASKMPGRPPSDDEQAGATPQSHEVYLTIRYFPKSQAAN